MSDDFNEKATDEISDSSPDSKPGSSPETPIVRRSEARRRIMKSLLAGSAVVSGGAILPEKWSKPLTETIALPAHAQTSPQEDDDKAKPDLKIVDDKDADEKDGDASKGKDGNDFKDDGIKDDGPDDTGKDQEDPGDGEPDFKDGDIGDGDEPSKIGDDSDSGPGP